MTPPKQTQPASEDAEPAATSPPKWKRHFERGTPKDALTWKGARQRSACMIKWRLAVMTRFASSALILRVAWLLDGLCQKNGCANATDSYICKTLGIADVGNLQKALAKLEKGGAIVRASSFVGKMAQRKIWPSTKIIPVTVTGMDVTATHGIPVTVTGEIQ